MNTRMVSGRQNSTASSHRSPVASATASSVPGSRGKAPKKRQISPASTSLSASAIPLSQDDQDLLLRQQAFASARQGEYEAAIAVFDVLIGHNPSSASHYNNRGLMHFQNGSPEWALADYNRAIQLNPKLAKVYNNRANCFAALGQLEAAIADYDQSIDLDPSNVHAWVNQGITYRDLELYEAAIENFELALQVAQITQVAHDPAALTALEGHIYAERGRAYHLLGDWNCAVADYHRALAALPAPEDSIVFSASQRLRAQVERWLKNLLSPHQ